MRAMTVSNMSELYMMENPPQSKKLRRFDCSIWRNIHCTSPKGADVSATAYSIINAAQANGIDVKEYLTNIFCTGERRLPLKSE